LLQVTIASKVMSNNRNFTDEDYLHVRVYYRSTDEYERSNVQAIFF
jgi:hypothetical protein